MLRPTGVHHVAIIASDYARSRRFYTEVLGLQVVHEHYRAERQSYKLDLQLPDGTQVELFCGFLGNVAGNLALTLGARCGVFIGVGMVPRLGTWFDQSPFRARFESKGRFQSYLATIPCWVIDPSATPALFGASRALDIAGTDA